MSSAAGQSSQPIMDLIADAAQWAWLRERCTVQNWSTGIELTDFPDHCWVLHAAYENPTSDPRVRCDELIPGPPGPGWHRVRWADLLARRGHRLEDWPHNLSWRMLDHTPEALCYPEEGVMDGESLRHLIDVLARHTIDGRTGPAEFLSRPIFADAAELRSGRLDELAGLHAACVESGSLWFPNNWWPADRSWLVCTDYDLMATEVMGSRTLVSELLAHPWLEAIRHPQVAEIGRDVTPRWPADA